MDSTIVATSTGVRDENVGGGKHVEIGRLKARTNPLLVLLGETKGEQLLNRRYVTDRCHPQPGILSAR